MRIISGFFKGKKILEPKDKKTRPLKDLTKESIFNIISHSNKFKVNIENSIILDLFAGIGSFGIECLSRGAKKVVFIENYLKVLFILKKNLKNLNFIENYEILETDSYKIDTLKKLEYAFDIIFLDPPYRDKKVAELLQNIKTTKILKNSGIIILHRHKNEKNEIPVGIKILEEKKYGISKIFFLSI